MKMTTNQGTDQTADSGFDLIPPDLAIESMRDAGYNSPAASIAELMDNAIQAKASQVELLCMERQYRVSQNTTWQIYRAAVADNGTGMDAATLRAALQFGNGAYLNDRSGIGRFGMGLPNSSISQCRRVDVWTWQGGIDNALYSYIDLDEVREGYYREIPEPVLSEVPAEWRQAMHSIDHSGTLVVWSNLDRLIWRRAQTLIKNSEEIIGRMYRQFLHEGNVAIRLTHFSEEAPSKPGHHERWAQPNDPSYLITPSQTPSPYDRDSMFERYSAFDEEIEVNGIRDTVHIEFAYVKPEVRRNHRNPGGQDWGKHAARNVGVSLMRQGRELLLDNSWSNGDHTERWWGVTVYIPATLDEVFGVDNTKQNARHFTSAAKLLDGLESEGDITDAINKYHEEGDPLGVVLQIGQRVRKGIKDLRSLLSRQREGFDQSRRVDRQEEDEAARQATAVAEKQNEEGQPGRSDRQAEEEPPNERKEELTNTWTEEGIPQEDAQRLSAHLIDSGLQFHFRSGEIESPVFFTPRIRAGITEVIVNTSHPAYEQLFEVLDQERVNAEEDPKRLRERLHRAINGLKLLLMAWARYEDQEQGANLDKARDMRSHWGMLARRFLRDE